MYLIVHTPNTSYKQGSVQFGSITFNDNCLNERYLVEGYCFNNKFNTIVVDCYPDFCKNDPETKIGRCINYGVIVKECGNECGDNEVPNDICSQFELLYGGSWYATAVDCETIRYESGDEPFYKKNFNDNLKWCVNTADEDLTVTCKRLNSPPDAGVLVMDCKGDCRDIGESPNYYCSDKYGSNYWATAVDCELMNIINGDKTTKVTTFDKKWDGTQNGWCEDTDDEDMTITCQRFNSKPDIKVVIIDCKGGGSCSNEGSPDEICRSPGIDYDYAIYVDCEAVKVESGGRDWDRLFSQKLDWCWDIGDYDAIVTCIKDSFPSDCNGQPGTSSDNICHTRCGANPECEGLTPNTGVCSGCYYTDINGDGKNDMKDIAAVAKRFGGTTGHFVEQIKPYSSIAFLITVIIFVVIILTFSKSFRKLK